MTALVIVRAKETTNVVIMAAHAPASIQVGISGIHRDNKASQRFSIFLMSKAIIFLISKHIGIMNIFQRSKSSDFFFVIF